MSCAACTACTAEREIKYKSERKFWEEQQKEVAARLAALSAELEAHRGASRAPQLEHRIQVGGCRSGDLFAGSCGCGDVTVTCRNWLQPMVVVCMGRLLPALLSRTPHACRPACLP